MFGSILAGQTGPSMQGIAAARGAAYHIYALIDRVSSTVYSNYDISICLSYYGLVKRFNNISWISILNIPCFFSDFALCRT